MHQCSHHRRIDPTRQPTQHVLIAYLRPNCVHALGDEIGRRPVGRGAADVHGKGAEDGRALGGVRHLGVELQAIGAAGGVAHGRKGRVAGLRQRLPVGRHGFDAVAVAHPDGQVAGGRLQVRGWSKTATGRDFQLCHSATCHPATCKQRTCQHRALRSSAGPYSWAVAGATRPPRLWASSCMP